ncbi:MAG: hypothetical protein M3389_06240 [Actinomycetota bacterium]|nr:hypothetical protein [Actinomycetota bacterium]
MDDVRRIADAVLYEGYLLWPYTRSALKNQRRWTWGGAYPPAHSAEHPDDRCVLRAQCLLRGDASALDVTVRFLQVVRRQVLLAGRPVDSARVGDASWLTWEEAVERELPPGPVHVPAGSARESVGEGVEVERSWRELRGHVTLELEPLREEVHRLTLTIANTTPFAGTREEALLQTMCSTHGVLRGATFLSCADPPEGLERACASEGLWPVLLDDQTMLCSPIILEDRPRIAPESPGDLFDGGEVDELLVLNILALTDEEKAEMRDSDPRAKEILERTEGLSEDQLLRLHGAWR